MTPELFLEISTELAATNSLRRTARGIRVRERNLSAALQSTRPMPSCYTEALLTILRSRIEGIAELEHTPFDLKGVCLALYGREWQTTLAREIGVTPQAVRKWASGKAKTPAARIAEIRALTGGKLERLSQLEARALGNGAGISTAP